MLDIYEKIDWAVDTIRDRVLFGLDDLNASLSRERRAKAILLDCKKEILTLERENKYLKTQNEIFQKLISKLQKQIDEQLVKDGNT